MNYDTFKRLDKIALNMSGNVARIQKAKPLPDILGIKVPASANTQMAGQQQMAQQKQPMQPKQPQTFMDFASDTLNTVKGVFSQVAKMQNPGQQVAQKQMPGMEKQPMPGGGMMNTASAMSYADFKRRGL